MIEAEEAFLIGEEGLQLLMDRIEDLIKTTIQTVIDLQERDIILHWKKDNDTEVSVWIYLISPLPLKAEQILLEGTTWYRIKIVMHTFL